VENATSYSCLRWNHGKGPRKSHINNWPDIFTSNRIFTVSRVWSSKSPAFHQEMLAGGRAPEDWQATSYSLAALSGWFSPSRRTSRGRTVTSRYSEHQWCGQLIKQLTQNTLYHNHHLNTRLYFITSVIIIVLSIAVKYLVFLIRMWDVSRQNGVASVGSVRVLPKSVKTHAEILN
jgi:hypothetical protein